MIELYGKQQPHSENLLRSLRQNRVAIDKGKTGTGKTYCAAWAAQKLGRPVGVVCPVAVIPVWQHVLADAGVDYISFVVGYEKLRAGNTGLGKFNFKKWEWDSSIDPDSLVIFDEFHRAKGNNSQNARIAAATKPFHTLLLSATIARNPTEMRALGYLTGLHTWNNFYKWCLRTGCWKGPFGGLQFKPSTAEKVLLQLHNTLFPKFGGGLRREDLGSLFKDNMVIAEAFNLNDGGKIQRAYEALEDEIRLAETAMEGSELSATALTLQAKTRQAVEILKVPALAKMAQDEMEEGNSVVIFTNYRASLELLCNTLRCKGVYGGQNANERQWIVEDFQFDKTRVIVVNIQAGSVGLSLHDLHGTYPRVSLICPTFSAVDLIQALGRIHRVNMKSNAVQKIIFAAGSVEEDICRRVQQKIAHIELLSDGDLAVDLMGKSVVKNISKNLLIGGCINPKSIVKVPGCINPPGPGIEMTPNTNTPRNENTNLAITSGDGAASAVAVTPDLTVGLTVDATSSRAHSRLSPSILKYKAICAGFENDASSDKSFADRGTLGHKAVEKEDLSLVEHDPALKAAVIKCIDYKHRVAGDKGIMQEVRLEYFTQWGYTDLLIFGGPVVDMIDWKFANNFYEADAPQFWAYCIGVWNKWPRVETINVHVVHPFLNQADLHVFTRANDYSLLSAKIAAIMQNKTYRVSENCAYCGFAGRCAVLAKLGLEIAVRYATNIGIPEDGSLHGSEITDPNVFAKLLRAAPVVEKAAEGWRRAATQLWTDGTEIPGYKMVTTNGKRTIASAPAAFRVVKEHFAPTLNAEEFLESCTISATGLDELVAAASPRGQKAKAQQELAAYLEDEDILTQGNGGRYLKAIRK